MVISVMECNNNEDGGGVGMEGGVKLVVFSQWNVVFLLAHPNNIKELKFLEFVFISTNFSFPL